MQIVIPLILIIIILVYVMGASVDITIPDFSWNKLAMMQEQTRQLEIAQNNETARWALLAESFKYLLSIFAIYLLYKLSIKLVDYVQEKEIRNAQSYGLLPKPDRLLLQRFGEDTYRKTIEYAKNNNAEIVLHRGQLALKKPDELIIIDE